MLIFRSEVATGSVHVDQPIANHYSIIAVFVIELRRRVRWRSFNVEEFIQDIEQLPLLQQLPSDRNKSFTLSDINEFDDLICRHHHGD